VPIGTESEQDKIELGPGGGEVFFERFFIGARGVFRDGKVRRHGMNVLGRD